VKRYLETGDGVVHTGAEATGEDLKGQASPFHYYRAYVPADRQATVTVRIGSAAGVVAFSGRVMPGQGKARCFEVRVRDLGDVDPANLPGPEPDRARLLEP